MSVKNFTLPVSDIFLFFLNYFSNFFTVNISGTMDVFPKKQ